MTDNSPGYTVDRLAESVVSADQSDISGDARTRIGISPTDTLGAACWDAREWLDRPGLDDGASADLLCYCGDPRYGPEVLQGADVVVLRGQFN